MLDSLNSYVVVYLASYIYDVNPLNNNVSLGLFSNSISSLSDKNPEFGYRNDDTDQWSLLLNSINSFYTLNGYFKSYTTFKDLKFVICSFSTLRKLFKNLLLISKNPTNNTNNSFFIPNNLHISGDNDNTHVHRNIKFTIANI